MARRANKKITIDTDNSAVDGFIENMAMDLLDKLGKAIEDGDGYVTESDADFVWEDAFGVFKNKLKDKVIDLVQDEGRTTINEIEALAIMFDADPQDFVYFKRR